jgi:hypothetical protein
MGPRVEALVGEYKEIWAFVPSDPVPMGRSFAPREKRSVERELSALVDRLSAETKGGLGREAGPDPDRLEELAAGLRPFLRRVLGLAGLPLETVYDGRFVESTRHFLKAARDFDPELGMDSVYQALRNVWIMNTLQSAMGLAVENTEAVFGYSMVYPYLDNFLDDDSVPPPAKLATLVNLKAWLEGNPARPVGPREEKLRALIGFVEGRFSRDEHPGVFRSMLTIYNAQIKSLLQQRRAHPSPDGDIVAISLEKGGTSVLADGYLVAGDLDPRWEDFCFGFGTFLQLADDLQDVEEDGRRGHRTVFSQGLEHGDLDPLLFKFLRFMAAVLEKTADVSESGSAPLRRVIHRSCSLMAMEAAGRHKGLFSGKCRRLCQKAFPVRFSYLRKLRGTLEDRLLKSRPRIADLDPVLAAFLALSSRAFSLD